MFPRDAIQKFLTNLDQPMPLGEKLTKLARNPVRAATKWTPIPSHDL